jgi:pimeloyl-ACP methyl ester carboxylesterase
MAATPDTTSPTVVLVHGAFADGSSWNGVIERLQARGVPVTAPAIPLRGVASDIDPAVGSDGQSTLSSRGS